MAPYLAARAMALFRSAAPAPPPSSPVSEGTPSDGCGSGSGSGGGRALPPYKGQEDDSSTWRSTRTSLSLASSGPAAPTLLLEPSDDDDFEEAYPPGALADQLPAGRTPVAPEGHPAAENAAESSRPGLGRREPSGSRGGGGPSTNVGRRASRLSTSLRRLSLSHLRRPSSSAAAAAGTGNAPHPGAGRDDGAAEEEEGKIDQMMDLLSDEQVEVAARTSYRYYCASASTASPRDEDDAETKKDAAPAVKGEDPSHLQQRRYARDMARRYLRSNRHHDPVAAAHKLAATLTFRQEMDVDGLRMAFHDPASSHRRPLLRRLGDRAAYVCGFDVDGRSTFVFEPHRVTGHDEHWTMRQHVYTLERAVACSRARDGTVNAVVNFRGFSYARHAPPTHIGQQFFTTLRSHYAGQVHQIFIVDAPGAFYCLWTLLKPFIGRTTRSKIQFVSSDAQKRAVIGRYYHPHQARPWMLPHGEKSRELDLDEYLFKTPFDKAFDDA